MTAAELRYRCGPLTIGFRFSSRSFFQRILPRYLGFHSTARPCISFTCQTHRNAVRRNATVSVVHGTDGGWTASRRDFECHWNGTEGILQVQRSVYAFDACLRVIISTTLPQHNGFLLHASSVLNGKEVLVFPGISGTGKTTIARMSAPRTVLNDEITAVYLVKNRLYASGTPFWGSMGRGPAHPERYPVAGFYFPIQSSSDALLGITPARALQNLMRCVCMYGHDLSSAADSLDLAARMIRAVPSRTLHFTKSPRFWNLPG
jgi:hypothetical protein